jgi:hypothetical protein
VAAVVMSARGGSDGVKTVMSAVFTAMFSANPASFSAEYRANARAM